MTKVQFAKSKELTKVRLPNSNLYKPKVDSSERRMSATQRNPIDVSDVLELKVSAMLQKFAAQ